MGIIGVEKWPGKQWRPHKKETWSDRVNKSDCFLAANVWGRAGGLVWGRDHSGCSGSCDLFKFWDNISETVPDIYMVAKELYVEYWRRYTCYCSNEANLSLLTRLCLGIEIRTLQTWCYFFCTPNTKCSCKYISFIIIFGEKRLPISS